MPEDPVGGGGEDRLRLVDPRGPLRRVARRRRDGRGEDVEERPGLRDRFAERLGAVLAEEGVGVVAPGKGDVEDLHAPLDEEREDLPRGRQARRVAVVGDDDGRDLPGEEVGLRRRQRRPHRGDGPRNAGPLERDPVEVPLAEDELLALPRPLAGPVEAVEDLPLREPGGFGAVDVLGRVVAEGPAAEREDLAARVADLEDQAVAEAVVDAPRVLVLLEEARPRGGPPR